jgi:hypothetical protein
MKRYLLHNLKPHHTSDRYKVHKLLTAGQTDAEAACIVEDADCCVAVPCQLLTQLQKWASVGTQKLLTCWHNAG